MTTEAKAEGQAPAEKMIPQSEFQKILDTRVGEIKARYSNYDDLVKFKTEHEKMTAEQQQKQMEEQKQYEELKKGWGAKEQQYQSALTQKEQEIRNIRVSNSLSTEIMKANAYPEAIVAMREMVTVKDDGSIIVKVKDANGIEKELSLEDGVKNFLKDRPYLVKSNAGGGSGTGGQGNPGGQGSSGNDLNLSQELSKAINSGDRAKVAQLKQQIRTKHQSMGV